MSRFRMLLIAFSALVLSLIVTFLAYRLLSQRIRPSLVATTDVVIALQKLELGARISPEQVRVVAWPEALKPQGSFQKIEQVAGRGVTVPMLPNEPILESRLAGKDAGAGLTATIPEGMRAVSVKVNDVIGVSGFVLPGTRVDLILTGSPDQNRGNDTSKVILENVQVLAAGQNIQQDENGNPQSVQVITLLVTPEDSQKVALASADGRIQLALRNPLDLDKADPRPVTKAALYTRASSMPEVPASLVAQASLKPVVHRPPPPPPVTPPAVKEEPTKLEVELIHGTERKKVVFEGTDKWQQDKKQ